MTKRHRKKPKRKALAGISDAMASIEKAMPISNDSPQKAVLKEFSEVLKQRTDNFSSSNKLSTEKIDISPLLKQEGVSESQWKATGNQLRFSEVDTVEYLASEIEKLTNSKETDSKAKKLKFAKVKLKLQEQRIRILELENK